MLRMRRPIPGYTRICPCTFGYYPDAQGHGRWPQRSSFRGHVTAILGHVRAGRGVVTPTATATTVGMATAIVMAVAAAPFRCGHELWVSLRFPVTGPTWSG
jgi:hypothetical protein